MCGRIGGWKKKKLCDQTLGFLLAVRKRLKHDYGLRWSGFVHKHSVENHSALRVRLPNIIVPAFVFCHIRICREMVPKLSSYMRPYLVLQLIHIFRVSLRTIQKNEEKRFEGTYEDFHAPLMLLANLIIL